MDTAAMPAGRFDHVLWVAETGSTNADLTEQAGVAPDSANVLLTDLQTEGRGRRDRKWDMVPGGGLLISFYVPWPDPATAHAVSTALGVAAVEAAAAVGCTVGLKWPNDLVIAAGAKVGGMLGNVVSGDGSIRGVVIGLGCNVSWPPAGLEGYETATCLDRLAAQPVDRVALATALISSFDAELDRVESLGASALHDRYRSRCLTIGRTVRVEQESGSIVGLATDIDPSGALLLEVDGKQRRVDVGDVVHLRPM